MKKMCFYLKCIDDFCYIVNKDDEILTGALSYEEAKEMCKAWNDEEIENQETEDLKK